MSFSLDLMREGTGGRGWRGNGKCEGKSEEREIEDEMGIIGRDGKGGESVRIVMKDRR
jgi:hypothetical protein